MYVLQTVRLEKACLESVHIGRRQLAMMERKVKASIRKHMPCCQQTEVELALNYQT